MNHKTIFMFAAAFLLLSAVGCVRTVSVPKSVAGVREKEEYPRIADCKLELQMVGSHIFSAGEPATVSFRLKNLGSKSVRIEEWRVNDNDNLLVFCQLWTPDMSEPYPDAWIPLNGGIPERSRRSPLELYPGNLTTLSRELPFIEKLVVPEKKERRYFVKAKLNLQSVELESPVSAILVRAPGAPLKQSDSVPVP